VFMRKTRGAAGLFTMLGAAVALLAPAVALYAPAAAQATVLRVRQPFTNWVVAGTLTPKKLGQPVELPPGSTFNGQAEIELTPGEGHALVSGTVTGSVFVPPFNATIDLGGVPSTVGVTFTQVGRSEGTIASAPEVNCAGAKGVEGSKGCVALSVPTRANLGITEVGLLGIGVPTHCETSEPVTLDLSTHTTLPDLLTEGPHFTGTTTIPPMHCGGLSGIAVGELLTTLMSGPENPYSLSLSPPVQAEEPSAEAEPPPAEAEAPPSESEGE
jgi:hypothetical protein